MTSHAPWPTLAAIVLLVSPPALAASADDLRYSTFWEYQLPNVVLEQAAEKATEQPVEKPAKKEAKTDKSVVNNRFKFTPYAAISAGYDTNFDEDVAEIDSYFQRYDLGMKLIYDHKGTFLGFETNGTLYDMAELADPDRWIYDLQFYGRHSLSKETELRFGFIRIHDELIDPQAIINEAYAGFEWKGPTRTFRFIGSMEHEINLTADEDFGTASADEFDFIKLTGDAKYQIRTKNRVSPFVRAKLSTLDFPGQDTSFINRNGTDLALIGGATVKVTDKLEVDLGGRYNVRHLDDPIIASHSNAFVDMNMKWKPSDKFMLRAKIERKLDEPGAQSSVVADVTEYELKAEWKPDKKVEVDLAAGFEKEREIGQGEVEREWVVGAAGYYAMTDHLRLFSKIAQYWNTEEETGFATEKYQRFEIRTGIETKF